MKQIFYLLSFSFGILSALTSVAQSANAPAIIWQKTIGGSGMDSLSAFCIDKHKSVIMCGSSNSGISGNKTEDSVGGYDYWIVKTDSSGNILWNKTFGGANDDIASAIIATSDGGYLVGGTSMSDQSGDKSSNSFASSDYWVLKLDADGNKIWDVTLGGLFTDILTSLAELPSGNYIAGGFSYSDIYGTKTTKNLGSENTADYWVLVLGKDGSVLTQNIYGGTSDDALACVSPSGTDGFYSAGSSYSLKDPGYKTHQPLGNNDYWIVRSDLTGDKQYEGEFGGNRSDYLTCMQVLADSSVILGGYSNSDATSSKTEPFLGVTDFWLVKIRPNGTKQWDKTIGGTLGDYMVSVQQTKDKGFLLGGYSNSNASDFKSENSKGGYDYWVVKTDSSGNVLWDETVGGSGDDILAGAYETDSDKYVFAGTSFSPQSGDKDAGTSGGSDFWVVGLDGSKNVFPVTLLSFTETIQQPDVKLNWQVSSGENINRFEVERSTDGSNFYQTAIVNAMNSAAVNTYQSVDVKAALLPFDKLYYRLKIMNSDGSFSYSNTILVSLTSANVTTLQVTPNPVKNTLTIQYNVKEGKSASFVLYSVNGKEIWRISLPATTATSIHTFNVSGLAKGVYYLTMIPENKNEKISRKIVKE